MQKKLWTLIIAVGLIFLSCSIVKREKYKNTPSINDAEWVANVPAFPLEKPRNSDNLANSDDANKDFLSPEEDREKGTEPASPSEPAIAPEPKPKKPVTHYDIETLDNAVRKEAQELRVPVETHRKLYEVHPGGRKVYRMIGTFVIVDPMESEEFYLPDEF